MSKTELFGETIFVTPSGTTPFQCGPLIRWWNGLRVPEMPPPVLIINPDGTLAVDTSDESDE